MTMKRNAKASHAMQLRNAREHGVTSVRFSSPKLCRAAKADRGHDYMTGVEYIEHRIGRRQASVDMVRDRLWTRRGFRLTESGVPVRMVRVV